MPQKSAPELFALVHYLHRLSTEGKRGAKMALESCPKCHFIMLEGVLMTIEEHGQNGTIYVSDLAAAVKQPLPAVSRALRQLEQDGLIERITDPNDRRKTLPHPGRAAGAAVLPDRCTAGGCGSAKCGATSKIEGRKRK